MRTAAIIVLPAALLIGAETAELRHYPLDNLEGVITTTGVKADKRVTADGGGALRVSATKPVTIQLFETGDLDIENARLIYRAKLKTQGLNGETYLEMWCQFAGKGEFFSRGLQYSLSGTKDWVSVETPFFLRPGENPDNVRLNLAVNGQGTVWIDDIRLVSAPLQ